MLPVAISNIFSYSCFNCVDFSIRMFCIFIVFLQSLHPTSAQASGGSIPDPTAGGLSSPNPILAPLGKFLSGPNDQ